MISPTEPDELLELVRALPARRPGTSWIGVDGLGASGKTTLALRLSLALPGSVVVHTDDFAPPWVREWERARFAQQVLEPLRAGRPARYQRWNPTSPRPGEWVDIPTGVPVIVEGVSATDVRLGVPWDLTVWLEVPAEVRYRRIVVRDSPALMPRWQQDWWPLEDAYVAAQQPALRADVVVYPGR